MKLRVGLPVLLLGLSCTTRLPDQGAPGSTSADGGVAMDMPDAGETLQATCLRWITAMCQYEEDCGGRSVDHCVDHAYGRCTSIVAGVNADLAQFERIKKFVILDQELTMASGALTPTMKVKRRVVEEQFRDVIDKIYEV